MTCFSCLFEAKSIQDYILRSGRLRHIVGASELIDSLTRDVLDGVLRALDLASNEAERQIRFSRRAGGAVYLFTNEREIHNTFRDLWTLTVRQYAPGLPFVVATGEGATDYAAYELARERLLAARNRQAAAMPAGTPVTRYAPRTGLPASSKDKLGFQDEATARFGRDQFWKREHDGLIQRFATHSHLDDWPRDLNYSPNESEPFFPFLDDNRYLGLLHADGNGLGQLLMNLGKEVEGRPDDFAILFRDVSEAIQRATETAAQQATKKVLEPHRKPLDNNRKSPYPARPIVLGGDDLTMLIRADLALPFAQAFLEDFEHASREQLHELRSKHADVKALPEALTAGAGIAFIKSNHPFYMAHELTEGLAKFAKDCAKSVRDHRQERISPTLAFYRVTTASHGDYREVREQELTFGSDQDRILTSLGAYSIDAQPKGMPALNDLRALARLFARESVARGPARQILTLIGQDLDEARRRYRRWHEVMNERDSETLKEIETLLNRLCGELHPDLPVSLKNTDEELKVTPLADLLTLLAIGQAEADQATSSMEDAS
ncbi:hypothetical protein CKO25_19125 [Thiocapsa imhoffii]|uniref:Cas10/Cmr2 second palm domain-containing protein n=1 Tax=Thiocapsa imhoffii TaxID=382777 RepID=A0A9X1BA91_9GAMM|nr:hypothetical protein [Thiocapsa imhoffii]MBK1646712.1 hypothetical protein [Thiocapsa imhoffii]